MLFNYESREHKVRLRYFITTSFILAYIFGSTVVALQFYKGYYWTATAVIFVMLLCLPVALGSVCGLRRESLLVEMPLEILLFIHAFAIGFSFGTAALFHVWEQVTLWDGAVLKGVEVWNTHSVVREWYGVATSVGV